MVVNFTGGDTWVKSLRVLKVGGRLLTCGATAGYDPQEDIRFIWTFELKVLGSNGWARSDIDTLLEHGPAGQAQGPDRQGLPLEEAREALARHRGPRGVRQGRGGAMSDAPKPLTGDELQAMFDRSPFIAFLGLKVTEADPARSRSP